MENITWHGPFIEYGKKQKKTKWHSSARSCFYVVKRSNISAHSAFISVESSAGRHREREREREFTLLTFPALSPSVCGALLLLLKRGLRKVHHGNRGIWWQEAFCEVAGADITHPIMQSSQQLPLGNKTCNFFIGFLLEVKRHTAIHAAESVSWTSRLYLITEILLGREKEINVILMQLQAVLFSPDAEKCHFTVDVGQEAQSGRLMQPLPRPGSAD